MLARRSLATLFVVMGSLQLVSLTEFGDAVATYRLGGDGPAMVVALALIVGELGAGVALWRRAAPAPAAVALLVALLWSLLAGQALARGLSVPNCGCFGRWFRQELRWSVLLQDAALSGQAAWVWARSARRGIVDVHVAEHAHAGDGPHVGQEAR